MNHQALMRILHGGAHPAKKLQATGDRKPMDVTVPVDRDAFHQLHYQIRDALLGRSSVQQAGDVRVVESRQDLAFMAKTLQQESSVEAATHDLDCNLFVVLPVGARCAINRAHAAVADLFQNVVRTNPARDASRTSIVDGRFFTQIDDWGSEKGGASLLMMN